MRADEDRNAILRGFKDAMAATRNETAANERDVGEAVKTGEFADGVDEEDAACKRFAVPGGAFSKGQARLLKVICDLLKALGVARSVLG